MKTTKAWHHEKNLGETIGDNTAQSVAAEDPYILEMPVSWDDHTKSSFWEWNLPELGRQAVYATEGRAREVTKTFWGSPEDLK